MKLAHYLGALIYCFRVGLGGKYVRFNTENDDRKRDYRVGYNDALMHVYNEAKKHACSAITTEELILMQNQHSL